MRGRAGRISGTAGAYQFNIYSTDGAAKKQGECYASINTNSPSQFTKSVSVFAYNYEYNLILDNGYISFNGITSGNYDGTMSWVNTGNEILDHNYAKYIEAEFMVYRYISSSKIDNWAENLSYVYSETEGVGKWSLEP